MALVCLDTTVLQQRITRQACILCQQAALQTLACSGGVAVAKLRGAFTFNAANGILRKLLPQIEAHQILLIDLIQVSCIGLSS